jgi:hypothetical protein
MKRDVRPEGLDSRTGAEQPSSPGVPWIVIDGRPFTWEQVGHMLKTFEGFTLAAESRTPLRYWDRRTDWKPVLPLG